MRFLQKTVCIVLLVFLVGTVSVSAAEGFTVSIDSEDTSVVPAEGDTARFLINVTNTGNEERSFNIGYNTGTASDPGWYYLDRSGVRLEPGESTMSTLYVTPGQKAVAGNRGPEIFVYPLNDANNRVSKFATFTILRESDIIITGFSSPQASYDPGESLDVSVTVKNVIRSEIPSNQYQLRLQIDDEEETVPVPVMESGESRTVSASLDLEGYRAGIYDLDMSVQEIGGDIHSTKTAKIEVNEQIRLERWSEEGDGGFLGSSRTAGIRNNGNVVAEDVNVTAEAPWYVSPFISFSVEPDVIQRTDGNDVFTWTVERLAPGSEATFSYSTSYWSLILVLAIILVAAVFIYRQFNRVAIVKSVKRADGRYSVHLRVKNNTGRPVKEVEIDDFVPGIAKLVEEYDSRKPSKVQNTDEGTKVLWDIGLMEDGEERIITYKIKPKIQVEGHVSLPSANVQYKRKGKLYSENSHSVSAEFR